VGFQDRPYYRQQQHYHSGGGTSGLGMGNLTPMVRNLLIINCGVFLLQLLFRNPQRYMPFAGALEYWFSVTTLPAGSIWQVWRLITFQFLHAVNNPFHLLFNMVALYFLGRILEAGWGAKKFLTFYLVCGAVGGLLYVLASAAGVFSGIPLVGASGGVLGLLVACAVLFPGMRVIVILFPMQIRTAAILFAAVFVLFVLTKGENAGGHLCHLGGMATGFVWVLGRPYWGRIKAKQQQGTYQRNIDEQKQLEYEVDRILAKVRRQGIASLTRREKQILQQATDEHKRG